MANKQLFHITKPRCFLVYALAPDGLTAREANLTFNKFVGDRSLPLVIFHDHFIGQPGGIAIFYIQTPEERGLLLNQKHLDGWQVEYQPLIFSYSPSALDEQTAYTLSAYRGVDWASLQKEERPSYGNPAREAETAEEDSE
ncbi:MAG: hypothetical protein HZB19_22330 [Chloroflexi bacterium]|nr:hypothetical protein [Chloroflexota bacterium]